MRAPTRERGLNVFSVQELSWKCALLERERAPFMLAAAEGEGEEATLVLEKMYSGRGERMAAAVIWLS